MLGCGKCLCGATQVKCGIKQICAEHSRTHLHKTVECFQHKKCNSTLANTKFYNFMAHSRLGFVFAAIKILYNKNSSLMDGNVQNQMVIVFRTFHNSLCCGLVFTGQPVAIYVYVCVSSQAQQVSVTYSNLL